jgi:hypothetical protein
MNYQERYYKRKLEEEEEHDRFLEGVTGVFQLMAIIGVALFVLVAVLAWTGVMK